MSSTTLSVAIDTDDRPGMLDDYRSRPKQLARWLLISRDQLRDKYRETKVELNRHKVRVSDVSQSRDKWKSAAELSRQELIVMKAEIERLTALVDQTPPKKSESQFSLTISIPPDSSTSEPPSSLRPAMQPVSIIPPGPPIDSLERLPRHSFSLSTISSVVGSVLGSSLSMLATIKTLDFFFPKQARQGYILQRPSWNTGLWRPSASSGTAFEEATQR